MPQEQVMNSIPPCVVISLSLLADHSLGAHEVVGVACLGDRQPAMIFPYDQAVVAHPAEVVEHQRNAYGLVNKMEDLFTIEYLAEEQAYSFRDHGIPGNASEPVHQHRAFAMVEIEADFQPGESGMLSQPDTFFKYALCPIRSQDLGKAAANSLGRFPSHEVEGLVVEFNSHELILIFVLNIILE